MGGCCCCSNSEDENIYQSGETSDKANLLGNPVGDSTSASVDHDTTRHCQNDQADEQAKLNKILQKTANSYIDVPALNSPMDQPDYKDREHIYNEKVKEVSKRYISEKLHSLLIDIPQPERILSGDPISDVDMKMMDESSSKAFAALDNIKVDYTENIVIPFTVP